MAYKAYWAYEFDCDKSLDGLQTSLNTQGEWEWQMRDSAWYGDYLNCRPQLGVRIRLHENNQQGEVGVFGGESKASYSVLLQIAIDAPTEMAQADRNFRALMKRVGVKEFGVIEPYD